MKKFVFLMAMVLTVSLVGCGGETPESVSKEWCEMTAKMKAAEGDARDKLKNEREAFEDKIEAKHKDDDAFMDKVKDLTSACD